MRSIRFLLSAIFMIGIMVLLNAAAEPDCQTSAFAGCMGGDADTWCKGGDPNSGSCCWDGKEVHRVVGCKVSGDRSYCADVTDIDWHECDWRPGQSTYKCSTEVMPAGSCSRAIPASGNCSDAFKPGNKQWSCCSGGSGGGGGGGGGGGDDPPDDPPPGYNYFGYHDQYSGAQPRRFCGASGWATRDPDRAGGLTVRVLYRESGTTNYTVAATVKADIYRADLAAGGCQGGTCGWGVDLWGKIPADTQVDILAQVQSGANTWVNLENSPKQLKCESLLVQGRKVVVGISGGETSPAIEQTITLEGAEERGTTSGHSPYAFYVPGGTYRVTAETLPNDGRKWRVGYSMCNDPVELFTCHGPYGRWNEPDVVTWSNTVEFTQDLGFVDLYWHYQPYQEQSYRVYAYSDMQPRVGALSNASFSYAWNGGTATSVKTGANGFYYIPVKDDQEGTSNTLTIDVTQAPFTVSGLTYSFVGAAGVSGCAAPSGVTVNGNIITITKSGDQDLCIPLKFTRTPTEETFGVCGMGFYNTETGTTAGLKGIQINPRLWVNGAIKEQATLNGNSNGAACGNLTNLNTSPARVSVSMPATANDEAGRQFNFSRWVNGPFNYSLPSDWTAWEGQDTTAPRSPEYWLRGTYRLAAEYEEVPELFTAEVYAYHIDHTGAVKRLSGIQPTLRWERATGNTDVTLTTNTNGYAKDERTFRTTVDTVMRFTFPQTITINGNANRQARFVGFTYNSAIPGCAQPPDWSSWAKNNNVLVSPAFHRGASRCIQALYEEIPQTFVVWAHAFYNNLATGAAASLPGVPVRVNWLRVNGETVSPSNRNTGLTPVSLTTDLLPYTNTSFQVIYPTIFEADGYVYEFRGFQAGAGGQLSSGWTMNDNVAVAGPFTYSTTRHITARYEAFPVAITTFNPLSPGKYYWKARDLSSSKPLPFVSGTISNAFPPGTPAGVQSVITITLTMPNGNPFFSYQVPVIQSGVNPATGYINGQFILDEAAVLSIEESYKQGITYPSSCTLVRARLCFGTTVGFPGNFADTITREDQAIGWWTVSATYARIEPDGRIRPGILDEELRYEVVWHMLAQP